jgi:hypothetical protein
MGVVGVVVVAGVVVVVGVAGVAGAPGVPGVGAVVVVATGTVSVSAVVTAVSVRVVQWPLASNSDPVGQVGVVDTTHGRVWAGLERPMPSLRSHS